MADEIINEILIFNINQKDKIIGKLKNISKNETLSKIRPNIKKMAQNNEFILIKTNEEIDKIDKDIEDDFTIEDILINQNGVCKIYISGSNKNELNNIIINDQSNKESNKNSIEEKIEKNEIKEENNPIEKNEIKEENNPLLNTVSEHLGEINDLIKDLYISIICKECGKIFTKQIELGKLVAVNMMIENKILQNCDKCGKNNYGVDIPYNLNMKCKNCGTKYFEQGLPVSMLQMILALKGNFKACEICGKNDLILISEGKNN